MEARQKSVVLILARELASNLATPLGVLDAEGTLVFLNEPAERLLGRSFQQTGSLSAEQLLKVLAPEDLDGSRLPPGALPLTVAGRDRRPNHRKMVIRSVDGARHTIMVTAFPLMETADQLAGVAAIFWEDQEAPA